MILLISTCSEKLHDFEFVRPIEKILKEHKKEFFVRHYADVSEKDLLKADKIIICGTSLKDNVFLKNIKKFHWIKNFNKPLLGICSGMQIIGMIYGGKKVTRTEIGDIVVNFERNFFGLEGAKHVYALHNNAISFSNIKDFEVFAGSLLCDHAVKHLIKPCYGVLFHPEVMNHDVILNFCKL